jgi:two-component system, cell cycle sensor histidine kinase and response regulator CckA
MAAVLYRNGRNRTILVVEDAGSNSGHPAYRLKRMGHVVLEACDGQEGLTISRKFNERIDLVISDIRMPKMDGPTMVRHLQADRPDVKVSLTSGVFG